MFKHSTRNVLPKLQQRYVRRQAVLVAFLKEWATRHERLV